MHRHVSARWILAEAILILAGCGQAPLQESSNSEAEKSNRTDPRESLREPDRSAPAIVALRRQTDIVSLIERLQDIEEGDLGYMPTRSGSRFLPVGKSQAGPMLLGQRPAATSATMRELVSHGFAALPELLTHLDDKRPTKIVLEYGGFFGGMYLADEYDFNRRTAEQAPQGVNADSWNSQKRVDRYTVTVGDLCFVALGQIVNRGFNAVRYQPTAIIMVNSPTKTSSLQVAVKNEWGRLSAKQHQQSLMRDFREPDNEDRRLGAYLRLGYYYPDSLESLVVEHLTAQRYNSSAGWNLIREQLYRVGDAEQRKQLFEDFVNLNGEAGRRGILIHLFQDLSTQEADEEGRLSPPLEEKLNARNCLIDLYGYPKTVKSNDQPILFVDDDYTLARFIDTVALYPSPRIDRAVRDTLHSTDEDYLASACVRYLAGRGADNDIRSYVENRLEQTQSPRREELQRFLDRLGWTPLHVVAETYESERVAALVREGADVNARAANGRTPLHVAADMGAYGMLRALLAKKADPNLEDEQGLTPLQLGLSYDSAAEILLEGGAIPTEILGAAFAGREDLVAKFLRADESAANARKPDGETPLHLAARRGHLKVAKLLIAAGGDVNAVDNDRSKITPLHWAAGYSGPEMVALLLEHGANRSATTWDNRTPLNFARDSRNTEVSRTLEERN